MRIKGEYTRGLENGKVKWNNVSIAMAMQRDAEFPAGTPESETFWELTGPEVIELDQSTVKF